MLASPMPSLLLHACCWCPATGDQASQSGCALAYRPEPAEAGALHWKPGRCLALSYSSPPAMSFKRASGP